jgi:hypothetical protein
LGGTEILKKKKLWNRMHRQPDHLIQYLFAELGTTGSIDGAQRLLIKGRFQQKQIEIVLKRYIGILLFVNHFLFKEKSNSLNKKIGKINSRVCAMQNVSIDGNCAHQREPSLLFEMRVVWLFKNRVGHQDGFRCSDWKAICPKSGCWSIRNLLDFRMMHPYLLSRFKL